MVLSAEDGRPRPGAFARAVVRRRGRIAAAWAIAALLLLPFAAGVERVLDVSARIDGSESAEVQRALGERFASPFARYAVLVASGLPSPESEAGRRALERVAAAVTATRGVTRVFSWLDAPDTLFAPRDGGSFLLAGLDDGTGASDALVPDLRATARALEDSLRAEHPGVALRWTGEAALNFDLRRTSAEQAQRAELRALPLTLALLVVAFGTLAAAVLPVGAGMLAIGVSLGAAALVARQMQLSILLQNVVSMLGLGLGVDYALLTVSRFREAMAAGLDAERAAAEAADQAGHTVAVSGAAVAVGFAALLTVPLNELRSVAVGGLLVTLVSVLVATTLLPGVLAWLGARVDAGRLVRRRRAAAPAAAWYRWASIVARHPVLILAIFGTPVALLAWQSRRLATELPRGDWLPPAMESAQGLHALQRMGRSGIVNGVRVVVSLPAESPATSAAGWRALRTVDSLLAADARVARVRSLPALLPGPAPNLTLLSLIPADARRTLVSADERFALLEVVPREEVSPGELTALVRRVRALDGATLGDGVRVEVGGLPAFNADYEDAVAGRFRTIVLLVVAGTLVALFAGFRSVLVPLKAVALNLLSVGAAFGAVVLVFQDGRGAALLGLAGPVDAVFPAVPVIVFCIVFGLSMDYEVFLVGRVAEARRRGASETEALAEGLARTGGVILSAAAVMVVVFGAFALGDFLLIKMLGFALAVAVLLDATVVRVAIGPALLRLAGKWNWWPGERHRFSSTHELEPQRAQSTQSLSKS